MSPVFTQGQLNVAAPGPDNAIVVINNPSNGVIQGIPTNIGGIVGTGTWGPVNVPVTVANESDAKGNFGMPKLDQYDLVTALLRAISKGGNNNRGVRVTDGTDTAASGTISDGTDAIAAAQAFYTGTGGNGITVQVASGTNSTDAAPTYAVTIQRPGYTAEKFDRIAGGNAFQQALVQAINQGQSGLRGPSKLLRLAYPSLAKPAAPSGTTAATGGTVPADTYYFACTYTTADSQSGSTLSSTVTGETTTSAASSGVTTTGATSTLTVDFGAIPTNATGVKIYGGTSANALTYWGTAATGTSMDFTDVPSNAATPPATNNTAIANTTAPSLATIALSGGTDGSSGVGKVQLIGTDGNIRMGMYALRGTGHKHFIMAGSTDTTAWTTMLAFGKSEGSCPIGQFPLGTSTSDAVTLKQSLGIDDWDMWLLNDHEVFFDLDNGGIQRTVPSTAAALGFRCSQSPEQSPANKPIPNFFATDRFLTGVPYSDAEAQQLEVAGIGFITNPCPGGNFFGFRHGQNASSDPTVNGLNYTSMTNFLAYSINAATGKWIGKVQSSQDKDPTRRQAKMSLAGFLNGFKTPVVPGGYGMIDGFSVTLDSTNNTPTTEGQGYMFSYVKVRYLGIIRWFITYFEGGQTVTVVSATAPNAA